MNDIRPTDRLLAAWLELEAPASAPDELRTDIYRATARIRPRPAWLARLGGHHMDVISGGARRRDTRLLPLVALLGLLLAAALAAVWVGSRPPANPITAVIPTASPARSAEVTAKPSVPGSSANADWTIPLPYRAHGLIPGDDGLYVSVAGSDTNDLAFSIYRIDEATNEVTLVVDEFPGVKPSDVVVFVEAAGSIWLVHDEAGGMLQFDASTGEFLGETPTGKFPIEPIPAFGDVWSQNYDDGSVTRVDSETGEVVATIVIPQFSGQGPRHMAQGEEVLWAVTPRKSTVVGIDPTTNTITREVEIGPGLHCGVAAKDGQLWVAGCDSPFIEVYDEATGASIGNADIRAGLPLPDPVQGIWVPSTGGFPADSTFLVRIDPETLESNGGGQDLGIRTENIVVGGNTIWFSAGSNVYRIDVATLPTP